MGSTMNSLPAGRSHIKRIINLALTLTLVLVSGLIAGFSLQKHYIATAFSTATIDGCPLFPADNVWNRDISTLSVDRNSANYIASIGASGHVHADFGAGLYAPVSQDWGRYNAIFEALEGEVRVYLDPLHRRAQHQIEA